MKTRILKLSMALAFLLSSYVFLSIRMTSPAMFNLLLKEPAIPEQDDFTTYGENYYIAGLISHFQEDMPQAGYKFRLSDRNGPIEEADLLIFGDSQFDYSRQTTFAERIADSLNLKVFTERYRRPYDGNVLAYLNDTEYKNHKKKFVIVESTERYMIMRSREEFRDERIKGQQDPYKELARSFRNKIFNPMTNSMYNTFLKKSYMTNWIYTKLSTLRFNLFGYINAQIPEFQVNKEEGSWLFHFEAYNYYNRTDISDDLIATCAGNLKNLQLKLREKYKLEMIYVIIPEQYTIYKLNQGDKSYHEYIPKIQEEFERIGIPYVNLYESFVNPEIEYFYKTDGHWNEAGVTVAVEGYLDLHRRKSIETE